MRPPSAINILICLSVVLTLACAKPDGVGYGQSGTKDFSHPHADTSQSMEGNGDYNGGGQTRKSTVFEVESAIKTAQQYFIDKNLFYYIYKKKMGNTPEYAEFHKILKKIVETDHFKGVPGVSYDSRVKDLKRLYSLEVLKRTKIKLSRSHECISQSDHFHDDNNDGKDDNEAAATLYAVNGEICFDVLV